MITERDILEDIGCSNWVKKAVVELSRRDVVDALNDLDLLKAVLESKFNVMRSQK